MFGELRQCGLAQTQTIWKNYDRQISSLLLVKQLYEFAHFGVCRRGLDVQPLVGQMIAGEKVFDVVRGWRPTIAQHPDSLEGRRKSGLPILEQFVQYRVKILFRWIPRL